MKRSSHGAPSAGSTSFPHVLHSWRREILDVGQGDGTAQLSFPGSSQSIAHLQETKAFLGEGGNVHVYTCVKEASLFCEGLA